MISVCFLITSFYSSGLSLSSQAHMGFPMIDHIPSTSTQNPRSAAVVTCQSSAVNNGHNRSLQREPATSPLRKLSVDLIKTYKGINEVCTFQVCSK